MSRHYIATLKTNKGRQMATLNGDFSVLKT